jgi:hypothetical protein
MRFSGNIHGWNFSHLDFTVKSSVPSAALLLHPGREFDRHHPRGSSKSILAGNSDG